VINFRYHVVSLTAVFLALAIGLVVGTAALNGPVADSLKDTVDGLKRDNSQLRSQVNQLQDEVNREEDFAIEAAPALVGGKLTGRRVLLVVLPTGQEYADGVAAMLTVAGGRIAGRVNIQDKFLAPANSVELLDLADQASQPTIPSAGLPLNSDGVETSSALLAKALLAKALLDRSPPVAAADLRAVLSAYSAAGYLNATEETTGQATATIVVSGLPPVDREADAKNDAAVTLVTQFAKDRPVIVAGSGVGDGNLVSQVRGDPTLVKSISTVDNAGTSQGQLVTALAAAERVVQDRTGQYGLGAGATSLMPKVAP
jgi:Copper transport outer membrane protein, MctB